MQEHFQHSDHAIMVFPRYDMNLRQVLKKYGRGVGIKLDALRVYAAQLLTSLRQLRHLGIVHADIKPDNILVTADKRKVVLADFGSAGDVKECEITPYLVSRYYRAPEISLGHQYDCAIDVWAIAATLYEMYTGEFMFKGHDNNEMLRMIQDIRGAFSHKMLRRSTLRETHFDDDFTFLAHPTKTEKKMKKIKYTKPTKDLFAILCPASTQKKMSTLDIKRVQWFKDLLDKMLVLDPHKRSTADHALNHPFFGPPPPPRPPPRPIPSVGALCACAAADGWLCGAGQRTTSSRMEVSCRLPAILCAVADCICCN
jgi:serine/threonine-protein kinase PRP4